MSRLVSRGTVILILSILSALLVGCSSGTPTSTGPGPRPASITLAPRPDVSIELGGTQSFSAIALNGSGAQLSPSPTITFSSNNNAVVEIAASGLACAGKWDSLSNPQICTPGSVGAAVITAVSDGVTSPPATVHVHQHIDNITIAPVTPPAGACFTKGTTFTYQASAFNRGVDITSSVGPFAWQTLNAGVLITDFSVTGLLPWQMQTTAVNPGTTKFFATNSGVNSQPLDFITCPVQSIALEISNGGGNSFTVASGSRSITATVTDTLGAEITNVPLTWSTSNAAAFTASNGSATSVKAGGATIIASCTPPGCNAGFPGSLVIYPEGVINATSTGTGTAQTTKVWVASSHCDLSGVTDNNCISQAVPIDNSNNTVEPGIDLPALPNSLVFDRRGARAYFGTEHSFLSTRGLAVLTPSTSSTVSTVTHVTAAPGKVLAISPDGRKIIVSDTTDTPNQVFVVDVTNATPAVTALLITGATAADFSPDSFKAYILAGNKLYIYSAINALQTIALSGPVAKDVSFLAGGAFAYVAGGSGASGVTVWTTCNSAPAGTVATPAIPTQIKTVPNGMQVLAVDSPGMDVIDVSTLPTGCSPTVSNARTSFNFGLGAVDARQLIVSSDGTRAYVIAANLGVIIVFNVDSQTTSTVQLAGSVLPIQASLTTDGKLLYVLTADGVVHVIDTVNNADTTQITLPQPPCRPKTGVTTTFTCTPDLIAVQP